MMRLVFLPVNRVYVFKFGDGLVRLHLPENLGPAPLFFGQLDEAMRVATLCGLKVDADGTVTTPPKEDEIEVLSRRFDPLHQTYIYRFKKGGKLYESSVSDDFIQVSSAQEVRDRIINNGKEQS